MDISLLTDLETRIHQATDTILPICVESGLFEGLVSAPRRKKAEAIATFVCCCAPKNASEEGVLLASRLTAVFFFLNDMRKEDLRVYVDQIISILRDPYVDYGTFCSQAKFFGDYLRDISNYGDTSELRKQFKLFLLALSEEADLISNGPISLEDYNAIRHRIIFVEEYLWTWILSEAILIDENDIDRTKELRRIASKAVYLVNDIGSIERERKAGGADPNLVFILEREQQYTSQEALDCVIQLHDETLDKYKEERKAVLAHSANKVMREYVSLIDVVIRGNLETTKRLSNNRYPGSYSALLKLKIL